MGKYDKIDKAYSYLNSVESFSKNDLVTESGWKIGSAESHLSKKLKIFVDYDAEKDLYIIKDLFKSYNREQFRKVFSQNYDHRTKNKIDDIRLKKAKESILTAVQIYNNPTIEFKSGSFIPLLFIGFTSLFHAIFERDNINYEERSTRVTFDSKPFLFDLTKCIKTYNNKYRKKHKKEFLEGLKINIDFLTPLRNDIEHRYCPLIDLDLYSSCQRALINFEEVMIKEFGIDNSLKTSLAMSLNFSSKISTESINAIKKHSEENYDYLRKTIKEQLTKLSEEDLNNQHAFFNVFIIPKKVKKESQSSCIEYIHLDKLKDIEDLENKIISYIPDKDKIKGNEVCDKLLPIVSAVYKIHNMSFIASVHLSKLAKSFKWNNKNSYNKEFMGKDEFSGMTYYRNKAIEYIEEQIKNKPIETLEIFASKDNIKKYKEMTNG